MIVVGMFFVYFWRFKIIVFTDEILKSPLKYVGWGLAYLILTPIVCLILLITVIGAPLSAIAMGLYFIFIYLAKIVFSIALGVYVYKQIASKDKKSIKIDLMKMMFLGVFLFVFLTSIPFVGWIFGLFGTLIGFGVIIEIEKKLLAPKEKK